MTSAPPVHATCVACEGQGVLLIGPSGSGKSDLALRLIDRGARLVGDDYVHLYAQDGQVWAKADDRLRDKIEVRGVGICHIPALESAPLALVVRLGEPPERLPSPQTETLAGLRVPLMQLIAYEMSTPIKIELALEQGIGVTQ